MGTALWDVHFIHLYMYLLIHSCNKYLSVYSGPFRCQVLGYNREQGNQGSCDKARTTRDGAQTSGQTPEVLCGKHEEAFEVSYQGRSAQEHLPHLWDSGRASLRKWHVSSTQKNEWEQQEQKRVGREIPGSENNDKFSGVRKRARPRKAVGRRSEQRSRSRQGGSELRHQTRKEARPRPQGMILSKLRSILRQLETVKETWTEESFDQIRILMNSCRLLWGEELETKWKETC